MRWLIGAVDKGRCRASSASRGYIGSAQIFLGAFSARCTAPHRVITAAARLSLCTLASLCDDADTRTRWAGVCNCGAGSETVGFTEGSGIELDLRKGSGFGLWEIGR